MPKAQVFNSRSGSVSGRSGVAEEPLVTGGLSQIGDHKIKNQEEKLRKQREYREILDLQKN